MNATRLLPIAEPDATEPRLALVPEYGRAPGNRGTFARLSTTLDAGESLWTPVLVYLSGWLLVLPAFLLMIGLSFGAYYLAGGE